MKRPGEAAGRLKRPGEAAGGAQWAGLLVAVALCACTTPERRFGAVPDAGVRSGERNETLQTEDAGGSPSGQEEASSTTETSGVESPSTSDTSSNWDAGDASGSTEAQTGDETSDEVSDGEPCSARPCLNEGRCVAVGSSYLCECAAGFEGDNCQFNVDDCVDHDCQNGSECVDGIASYTCRCAPGYEGLHCEIDTDDCAPNPCSNGGTCQDRVDGFSCACVDDFGGPTCDVLLFEPLGFLTDTNRSRANAISGNGEVVVGNSTGASGDRPFIWSNGQMRALASANGEAFANTVNFDGSVVAGGLVEAAVRRGAFWREPYDTLTRLYSIDNGGSEVVAINDASTKLVGFLVGRCSDGGVRACRWAHFDSDPQVLPPLDPFNYDTTTTIATDVSSDGSVIVGYTTDPFRAFRWSQPGGWVTLHGLTGDDAPFASVVTADGSVVFGTSAAEGGTDERAVRWVGDDGVAQEIGFGRRVTAANADGSLLVIDGLFVWSSHEGPRGITEVLAGLGADLSEWHSVSVTGVSADGKAFSGYASKVGSNDVEAVMIRLP